MLGTQYHRLDGKCRVVMRRAFVDQLRSPFMLLRGPRHTLLALSCGRWKQLLREHMGQAEFRDFFASGAQMVEADPATGRVCIPRCLREHARLDPRMEVAVAGIGSAVILCDAARWTAHIARMEELVLAALGVNPEEEPLHGRA
jgi:DNA-binding transcriptional regulator/RsmH inhibitor MraZ